MAQAPASFWSQWAWPWLERLSLDRGLWPYLQLALNVVLIVATSLMISFIFRRWLKLRLEKLLGQLRLTKKATLLEPVLRTLMHLVTAFLLYNASPLMLADFPAARPVVSDLALVYLLAAVAYLLIRLVDTLKNILSGYPKYAVKPLDSYAQLINIGLYLFSGILIVSSLMDKNPLNVLTILGGTTAILLLVFKDPILGFVASIQLSANDMVRVGDWIQMDKYHANGQCLSITLSTVKVQNWDKTVTYVPTYSLISDSFINWRFMEELGRRRFIRVITFRHHSVKLCSAGMLEALASIELLREWLSAQDFSPDQAEEASPTSLNQTRPTNLMAYCRYAEAYLAQHPRIDVEGMLLVDQLEPSREGVPVRMLAFSREVGFVGHQQVQTEVFDHLVYASRAFGLQLYEAPGAEDVRHLGDGFVQPAS